MKRNKRFFKETGLCASFTFRETLSVKANRVGLIVMILVAAVMPVLTSVFGFFDTSRYEDPSVKKVIIINQTDYLKDQDLVMNKIITDYEVSEVVFSNEAPGPYDLKLTLDMINGRPMITAERSKDTKISDYPCSIIASALTPLFMKEYFLSMGISEETADLLNKDFYCYGDLEMNYENDFGFKEDDYDDTFTDYYSIQFPVALIMMMLCIFSASYIIREVILEKSSKLAETLMIGLSPDAMLFGKILGVLGYVSVLMFGSGAVYLISNSITSRMLGEEPLSSNIGDFLSLLNQAGFDDIFVMIVTMLLGILMFSILSGLMGAGCEREEDTSAALGIPMILIMVSYMVGAIWGSFAGPATSKVMCIVPCISSFVLPVRYMVGEISMTFVLISWFITITLIYLLNKLSGKVYASLLVYSGKRLGFLQIVKMAGMNRKEAKS